MMKGSLIKCIVLEHMFLGIISESSVFVELVLCTQDLPGNEESLNEAA
jgi:hypothetical protein